MDIQMPVLDGVGATRALRQEYPSAKIIVLTTYSGDAQAARALKGHANLPGVRVYCERSIAAGSR